MSDLAGGILWSKSRLSHQILRMEARGRLAPTIDAAQSALEAR